MSNRFFFRDATSGLWDFGESGGFQVRNFYASGSINGASLTTTGNATVGGTLGVTGATTLSGLLTANANIKFPATQVAAADANTLDDYEEGTFTPVVVGVTTAGDGTYSQQRGRYTKIGNRVFFTIYLSWSDHTGTGAMEVSGLPFTSLTSGMGFVPFSLAASGLTWTAGSTPFAYMTSNSSRIFLREAAPGGAVANLAIDTSVSILSISGHYETAT